MTLSFIVSNLVFKSVKTMAANATNTPYIVDYSNYDKPQPHQEQSILADVYKDTPGYQPSDGNIPKGWSFYETELFPVTFINDTNGDMEKIYHNSPTAKSYMVNAHYWTDTSNTEGTDYYDNWRFDKLGSKNNKYVYGNLIYYQQLPVTSQSSANILGDTCNVEYKIDTNTFDQGSNNGTTAYNKMPDYTSLNAGAEYVADYHISGVTANPVAIAPTADFYFNSGSTSASVQAGDTLKVIDGKGYGSGTTYSDKNTKYWSTYWDGSGTIYYHNGGNGPQPANGSSLPQSFTYNNAIITGSSWSVYDSSGQNVNNLFNASSGLKNQSNDGAYSEMDLSIGSDVPAGTYTVHHSVTDNWGSSSQDQTRTFTVSQPPQKYNLTVHYVDQTGNEISGTEVDNAPNPYTPAAPNDYSLTGNYRTSATGSDSAFNYNNGTEINVNLSSGNKVVYVVCSAIISKSKLNAHYVDADTATDITDVSNVSNPYTPHAPQGYKLTGNYRTSSTGTDISYTNSITAAMGVSDIYIMCKKVNSEYTLNVTYVDEATSQTIPGYGDTVYYDDSSTNVKHSNGSEFTTYLPDDSKTPAGYTLDTSKYFDPSLGYFIEFDSPVSMANENGHSDGKTANLQVYCTSNGENVNPTPVNNPPTVTLNLPPTVALGDDLNVVANGSDPDGDTLTYSWNTPNGMTGDLGGIGGIVQFDNPSDVGREKTFIVTVNDGKGGTATATATTKVVEPQPTVSININGILKENRKVTLSETSYSGSKSYSIDNSKTTWAFYDSNNNPINATNSADSGIVESLDSTTGTNSMNVLFTKAGTYTVKCTVYNNYGATATDTKQIAIVQDAAPIADFTVPKTVYRDPDNGNLATLQIKDNSYSSDGDTISKRIWFYAFDSNNDGSFDDETFYVYDVNLGWKAYGSYSDIKTLSSNRYFVNSINAGNLTSINIVPQNFNRDGQMQSHVGKYRIVEIVQENFGQDTIQSLVTSKDYRVGIESTH